MTKQNRLKSLLAGATAVFDFFLVIGTTTGLFQKWGITEGDYKTVTGAVVALGVNLLAIYNNPTTKEF